MGGSSEEDRLPLIPGTRVSRQMYLLAMAGPRLWSAWDQDAWSTLPAGNYIPAVSLEGSG